MSYYRLYHLDPATSSIIRFDEFEASDDGAAEALAETKLRSSPMELWQERRKVRRFDQSSVGHTAAEATGPGSGSRRHA